MERKSDNMTVNSRLVGGGSVFPGVLLYSRSCTEVHKSEVLSVMKFSDCGKKFCKILVEMENNCILVPTCQLTWEMRILFNLAALVHVLISALLLNI